ncbi:MAG: cadherin repeat domain-containing protein [Chloroflexaceae bacterium]|nr:cadherin repeat domain-containing protein [Chloroflexaceae bacterium]
MAVGSLPDAITFSPDGSLVLVANEGEPNDEYTVDPEGSISIIDLSNAGNNLSGLTQADVTTAGFTLFNGQQEQLIAEGIRIFGPNATVAQDLEPELVAVAPDGLLAFATLQENNAIAIVDLDRTSISFGTVLDIVSLGTQDFSQVLLDASDRDGGINLQNYPGLFGFFQPDAIASFTANGETFYVTANEGDTRDFDGFSEEVRVEDLLLDPAAFPDLVALLEEDALGRLLVTNVEGDSDGDGLFEELFASGGRSFSILDTTGNVVFDSSDLLERLTAALVPELFNSNGDEDSFDTRSDNRGPEPEGVVTGVVNGQTYAFLGLERTSGIVVFNISDPLAPTFVQYLNAPGVTGDIGPEGLTFVSGPNSPSNRPLLVTANEISGSTTIFEILSAGNNAPNLNAQTFTLPENSPNGTVAGTIIVDDPDEGDTFTFAITAGNLDVNNDGNLAFATNSSGQVVVNDSGDLNFEIVPTFTLNVTVTDAGGLSDAANVTINLTNVVENQPPVINDAAFSVVESSPNGTVISTLTASDLDGDAIAFAIATGNLDPNGNGMPAFVLNAQTGLLAVNDSGDLVFDTTPVFTLNVSATDPGGLSDTANVTINLLETPTPPLGSDIDGDGVPDAIEDLAGDRNQDDIPDSQQANVASVPRLEPGASITSEDFFTLVAPLGFSFQGVEVIDLDELEDLDDLEEFEGALNFAVEGPAEPGEIVPLAILLPGGGVAANAFFVVGEDGELESILHDGDTGALLHSLDFFTDSEGQVLLDLEDDGPGDSDSTNGRIQVESLIPLVVSSDVALVAEDNQTLFLDGPAGVSRTLEFTLSDADSDSADEIGYFFVDNALGEIDGIAPGESGYLEAAFGRAEILLSALPEQDILSGPAANRRIQVGGDNRLAFFRVIDGTVEDVLAGRSPAVQLSLTNASEGPSFNLAPIGGGFSLDFGDVALNAVLQDNPLELLQFIGNRQGEAEQELFDLRLLQGVQVSVNFAVDREAEANNFVGFFQIENEQGAIIDTITGQTLLPGDAGYSARAIAQRVAGIDLNVGDDSTASFGGVLEGGALYAPFIIADGDAGDFAAGNADGVFFPFTGANSDGVDHVRLLGDNIFGFEDIGGGGDLDYDDIIVRASFQIA